MFSNRAKTTSQKTPHPALSPDSHRLKYRGEGEECGVVLAQALSGRWVLLIALLGTWLCLQATPVALAQATPPTLPANASIEQILDALHARGVGLNDFRADVSLAETDNLTGDTTTRLGKVYYQAHQAENARLRAAFDIKKVGQRIDKESKVEYLLDKGILIDRDYRNKIEVSRQMIKPGEKMNLLKLGEGPFPLPIGQQRQDVLKMFAVAKVTPDKDDPTATQHIQLTPAPNTRFAKQFKTIDVWVENTTSFPVRVATTDIRQTEVRTTDFSNIKVNNGLQDGDFALEKIKAEDWNIRAE